MSRYGRFKRLLAHVTWSCAFIHSPNLFCDGKTEWPLILTTSSTSRVLWRTWSPPSCSPQTPTRFSQKEAVGIWALRGLGKRLKPPTKRLMTPNKEGTPNPDPSSISLMLYKLVGVVLHSSGTYREGFVFLALAKSNYPRPATSCFNAVLTTCFLRDQEHLR